MFKSYKKLFNIFTCVDSMAFQIRNHRNRIIYQNEAGQDLFPKLLDSFFEKIWDIQQREKIKSAIKRQEKYQSNLLIGDSFYKMNVDFIEHQLILRAWDISKDFEFSQFRQNENISIRRALDELPYPFYISDSQKKILMMNQALKKMLPDDAKKIFSKMPPVEEKEFKSPYFLLTSTGKKKMMLHQRPIRQNNELLFFTTLSDMPENNDTALHSFFETAGVPMITIDGNDLTVLETNTSALSFFKKDIKDFSLSSLLEGDELSSFKEKLSKKNFKFEISFLIDKDLYKTAIVFVSPYQEDLNTYVLWIMETIDQKQMKIQSEKMQAMGQLAGMVAHDFNNLLTAMIGFSDLLLARHPMGDPSFADIMQIKHNANRAGSLVKQLLAFSKKQPLKPQLISVSDSLSDLTALINRTIGAKIQLKTAYSHGLGYIKVDSGQLTQVFLNLAVNARDAMPNGGTFIIKAFQKEFKRDRPIKNDIIKAGEYVVFEISDTGCGIADDIIDKIFEPFFSTKHGLVDSGLGWGLATVYGIISQTNGYITVKSKINQGTTFTIYLPKFDEPTATKDTKDVGPLFNANNAHILLVEDEIAVRKFTTRALENKGFQVTPCANGGEALKLFTEQSFDLLLTDMMMPGMTGEELATKIKQINSDIPIILMSGYSQEFSNNSDITAFLSKPFSTIQLLEKISSVLSK